MCPALGLIRDSINLRALATAGSSGVTFPVWSIPVTTMPVTPRLRGGVPHDPSAFCDAFRMAMALSVIWSQSSAARDVPATMARAITVRQNRRMNWLFCGDELAMGILHGQTGCRVTPGVTCFRHAHGKQ